MKFETPDLPYNRDALEPHISEETLNFHYDKHHKGYVANLNKKTADTPYEEMSLEEVIRKSFEKDQAVFNNAAQTWNHTFLWNSMSEDSDGKPRSGSLAQKLDEKFGDLSGFRAQFKEAALGQFGSGWVWLVVDGSDLAIVATPNAHNPLTTSATPILTLDVWEHAYYLDFQNERGKYTDAFLEYLINWEFAQANYDAIRNGAGMAGSR